MRSATSLEGPRLVRIAVPYAQIRMAIDSDAFSNERREASRVSRGLLSMLACRPRTTEAEPQAKRETRSVLCYSLVVDSTFEQSENVAIAVVSSSSCC